MTQQFRVVISGRTLSGAPLETVKAEAGRVFRLEGEQLEQMFSGKRVVVARQASPEKAEKLLARLHALDLEAALEALAAPAAAGAPDVSGAPVALPASAASEELFALIAPPVSASAPRPAPTPVVAAEASAAPETPPVVDPAAEMICPKCGEGQPKRTLCRRCGTDMPRYQAAQEEADREAREARAAEIMALRSAPGPRGKDGGDWQPALLGMGFSGRLGCLDYAAATLLSSLIWLLFTLLAAATGKLAFSWLGLFLSSVYYLRCLALRLHDTGRSGWLSLVAAVPGIDLVMMIVLLFVWGDQDENDYGQPAASPGHLRAIASLLVVGVAFSLSFRSIGQDPVKLEKFVFAASLGQSKALAGDDDDDEDGQPDAGASPQATVRYAGNNRIDIYLTADCTDCTQMRAWLDANRLRYTVYAVDSDEQAAQRLHSITAGNSGGDGQILLPVLEVNGKVLPGNPDVGLVHRQLRQAPAS